MGSKQVGLDYRRYTTVRLNGQLLDGQQILDYCKSGRPFLHAVGDFIAQWLSPENFLEVSTSGSTGPGKTIRILKNHMLQSAALTAGYFGFRPGMRALLALPVNYIAGKMMVVRAFYSALDLHCYEPASDVLEGLGELEFDFAPLVPMQMTKTGGVRARKVLLGGAPLSPQLEQRLQNVEAQIFHGFGMTETLSHAAIRRVNGPLASHVYDALPGVLLETDERSCLRLKMPWMPDFVSTNDVVDLLSASQFRWKGRADFVINSGGIKLFPEEIERKIGDLGVRFFIHGMPDEYLGQKACLFVEGQPFEVEGFFACLAGFEKPKRVFFVPDFIETGSGKVNRVATVALVQKK